MMKYKGKEYPVSTFKVHVHDTLLERLDWIRKHLKLENNVQAFTAVVNSVYQQLHALDEYYKNGNIPEQNPKDLNEDTK
jgi:hypothetical protein